MIIYFFYYIFFYIFIYFFYYIFIYIFYIINIYLYYIYFLYYIFRLKSRNICSRLNFEQKSRRFVTVIISIFQLARSCCRESYLRDEQPVTNASIFKASRTRRAAQSKWLFISDTHTPRRPTSQSSSNLTNQFPLLAYRQVQFTSHGSRDVYGTSRDVLHAYRFQLINSIQKIPRSWIADMTAVGSLFLMRLCLEDPNFVKLGPQLFFPCCI